VTLRTPVVICYRCGKCGEIWTVGKPGISSAPHWGSVLSRRAGAPHQATSPPSCPPRTLQGGIWDGPPVSPGILLTRTEVCRSLDEVLDVNE